MSKFKDKKVVNGNKSKSLQSENKGESLEPQSRAKSGSELRRNIDLEFNNLDDGLDDFL